MKFEPKFKSEIILKADVPFSIEEVQRFTIERWGELSGKKKPSFFPGKEGGEIFLSLCAHTKNEFATSRDYSDFITHEENLFFPNAHGLVVAEELDLVHNFIPVDTTILGIDFIFHLFYDHIKEKDHLIPALKKKIDGSYEYFVFPFNKIPKKVKFLVYKKEELAA